VIATGDHVFARAIEQIAGPRSIDVVSTVSTDVSTLRRLAQV
jgi:hypothetical protein